MPITHEQYIAEQAASIARYLEIMAEVQQEFDDWWARQGELPTMPDAEGKPPRQGRRRKNQPVVPAYRTECATDGCTRDAWCKGYCRPCYLARYRAGGRAKCACGCGKVAQTDGYARSCYTRRVRELTEQAQGLPPYDGPRCSCGARLDDGARNPETGELYRRCATCRANMRKAAQHRKAPERRQAA